MSDPADDRERRELERRAFARDGSGLSAAEAARLAELWRIDLPSPVPERPSSRRFLSERSETKDAPRSGTAQRDEGRPSEEPLVPERAQRDEGSAPPPSDPPTTSRSTDGSGRILGHSGRARLFGTARARIRTWIAGGDWQRPRYLVGGLGALVLVGVLIGWAIPRPSDVGLALRAGESARAAAVQKHHDDLDPGSLLLLARERDGLLWYATQANGQLLCAILDVRAIPSQKQCLPRDQLAGHPLGVSSPSQREGVVAQDGYSGTVVLSGRGVPFGVLTRFQMMYDGSPETGAEERAAMRRVVVQNNLVFAQVVGRVGKTPVRLGDDGRGRRCLVVEERAMQKICAPSTATAADPLSGEEQPALSMRLAETPAHPAVRLDFWAPPDAGQYLVISPDTGGFRTAAD